jgi:hypothetical protein
MGEPSLQAVGILGSAHQAWATRSHSSCYKHKGTKPLGSGSSGACLPVAGIQELQELLQSKEKSLWAAVALGTAC